ncbi:hypothetical protein BKA69DRAFT_562236 [Paraphysoderma sedebokerense]|nr:hypothetical protein BKA69DRAFT_562236 [Paraphysoderma sedebokerense]
MAWMYKLSESVNVKMTFYFYSILQKTATMEQSKLNFSGIDTVTSKLNPNIFDVIKDFVKQSRAFNVSLMFQVDKSIPFHIDGYSCAELAESYDGLNSYPTIYSYPNLSTPSEHLPNIVSLILSSISGQSPVLELGSCIQFYDNKVDSSYFVLKLDAQVLLTVIYKEKRNPKCQVTLDFLELVQDCVWLRSAIDDLNERL